MAGSVAIILACGFSIASEDRMAGSVANTITKLVDRTRII